MSRSRVRKREHIRRPVELTTAAYAAALRPVVANLRTLAEDATARPSQRQRARVALRRDMLKSLRALEARIDVADPQRGDPAGNGGAGPVH